MDRSLFCPRLVHFRVSLEGDCSLIEKVHPQIDLGIDQAQDRFSFLLSYLVMSTTSLGNLVLHITDVGDILSLQTGV